MNNFRITLLKGDGIGPEIVNQAVKVLDKAAEKFFARSFDNSAVSAYTGRVAQAVPVVIVAGDPDQWLFPAHDHSSFIMAIIMAFVADRF